MMNYILPIMLALSFVSAMATGRMNELSAAVIEGGTSATGLLLNLVSVMCFWGGVMEVAEKSGITTLFSRLIAPIMKLIFPRLRKEKYALEAISMNVAANILGIGNAATPLGIEAMKRLQQLNPDTKRASDEMVVFVVMNTAAMRLIPTTVAALRGQYGSAEPMSIIVPTLLTTLCSMVVAVATAKIGCLISEKRSEKKCFRK
ncbi:MAG: spore maturation protein A [Clostridia bacterium]|nr:spore maturation protein A [Clostridia bacterium]